jgi:hypothetical protein
LVEPCRHHVVTPGLPLLPLFGPGCALVIQQDAVNTEVTMPSPPLDPDVVDEAPHADPSQSRPLGPMFDGILKRPSDAEPTKSTAKMRAATACMRRRVAMKQSRTLTRQR